MGKRKKGSGDGGKGTGIDLATIERKELPRVPMEVPLVAIAASPWQPREEFDEAELQGLAASMAAIGLGQRIGIRRRGTVVADFEAEPYELVYGERRLRAAKLLGWETIPADLIQCDDDTARDLTILENLQRKDLNAIEEARGFQSLLAREGATQTELARRLGISQPHVANRLRLLKLPEPWQKKIISQEIPPTHARALLPYADHPEILAEIGDHLKANWMGKPAEMTVEEFRDGVNYAADRATRPMVGRRWSSELCRDVKIFTPTYEERAELAIISIDFGDGEVEERATNVKLWTKLFKEHGEKLAKTPAGRANGKASAGKAKSAEPRTEEDREAAQEEERRKRQEQARQFKRRLEEFREDWLRWLIARAIRRGVNETLLQIAILALRHWWAWGYLSRGYGELRRALARAGQKVKGGENLPGVLLTMPMIDADRIAGEVLADLFYSAEEGEGTGKGPCRMVSGRDLEAVAAALSIDLEACWLNEQAGDLSQRYWEMHTKDQLIEIGEELGLDRQILIRGAKKADLVALFLARKPKEEDKEVGLELPKELGAKKRKRK